MGHHEAGGEECKNPDTGRHCMLLWISGGKHAGHGFQHGRRPQSPPSARRRKARLAEARGGQSGPRLKPPLWGGACGGVLACNDALVNSSCDDISRHVGDLIGEFDAMFDPTGGDARAAARRAGCVLGYVRELSSCGNEFGMNSTIR